MDQILNGIQKCVCKQDDILIGGDDKNENIAIVEEVSQRLSNHNVHLKLSKCEFLKSKVVYLGFEFDAQGLRPVRSKIEDILKAPVPTDTTRLKSFLGMIQYYH